MKNQKEIFELCKNRLFEILKDSSLIQELKELYATSPDIISIKEHSISELQFHHLGLFPSINCEIELYNNEVYIGYFSIYWDKKFNFLDEFLVFE